ncbi:unnamed protein product [Symbiodinium necroappetens]|uniref:BTB domain-containing protein n=1 Tax=Symbiodinium necroappetens TaxID=1628268 RepID=A0A812R2C8_9DINO|nr:unnamed protein product [Symbiodinium necroappetens]
MSSAFKRLKVSEDGERITWRNPRFSDWELRWGDRVWRVHCCVLVGGKRPAHFFAGASREGVYEGRDTDLAVLCPEACKDHVERALDFIYGEDLGAVSPEHVMPLLKIADTLQCPTLQNTVLDAMEHASGMPGAIEVWMRDACIMNLNRVLEELVACLPRSRLINLNLDILDNDNVLVMRAVAKRMVEDRMVQWGSFEGHGQLNSDGSISLSLPTVAQEQSRRGLWCRATGLGEASRGRHVWRIRVDSVPTIGAAPDWYIVAGVISREQTDLSTNKSRALWDTDHHFLETYQAGSLLNFHHHQTKVLVKHAEGAACSHQVDNVQRLHPGDVISICLDLNDGTRNADIVWRINDTDVAFPESVKLSPTVYRVGVELYKHLYQADSLRVTLEQHTGARTAICDGNCRLLDDKFGKTGQRMSRMPSLRKDALKYLYICPVLTVGHLLSGKVPDRLEIYVVLLLVDLEQLAIDISFRYSSMTEVVLPQEPCLRLFRGKASEYLGPDRPSTDHGIENVCLLV